MEPAEIYVARGITTQIQHNRRIHLKSGRTVMNWDKYQSDEVAYDGPIDPGVRILEICFETGRRVFIVNGCCHPTIMGGDNLLITGDWPSAMCRHVCQDGKQSTVALYMQGACGDVGPLNSFSSFEGVDSTGRKVAEVVKYALNKKWKIGSSGLGGTVVPLQFP